MSRKHMARIMFGRVCVALGGVCVALALSACDSLPEPYVVRPWEFNRDSAHYPDGPDKLEEVLVCYNKRKGTPEEIAALATSECGTVGARAVFREQVLDKCPLLVPIGSRFACVGGRKEFDYGLPGVGTPGSIIEWTPNFLQYGKPPIPVAPPDTSRLPPS